MKKVLVGVGVIVLAGGALLFVTRTFYPDNVAETSVDGGVKGLKTRTYKTDLETAAKSVREIIPTLSSWGSNWKLVEEKTEGDTATIKAEVPVVVFMDDLTVNIERSGPDTVTINIRSASRVGQSDFGENRRHVVQILEELDKRL